MSDQRGRTSLTPYAASMRDADPDGARELASQIWRQQGIAIFLPAALAAMPWQDRQLITQIATRLYGETAS